MDKAFQSDKDVIEKSNTLTLIQNIAYSFPYLTIAFLTTPMHVLQAIYIKHYEIKLSEMAAVLLLSRIFDAIADPLVGIVSDYYKNRFGTRRPILIVGILWVSISAYYLFIPPEDVTVMYVGFWLIMFYFGWTMFEIPHLAWGGELSDDNNQRIRLFSFRTAAGFTGVLCFYSLPMLLSVSNGEITPDMIRWCGVIALIFVIPNLFVFIKFVPDGSNFSGRSNGRMRRSALVIIRELIDNRPLLLFLGVFSFIGLGSGMWFGLLYIYIDSYLLRGDLFASAFVVATIVGVLSTFLWYRLCRLWGKKYVWGLGIICQLLSVVWTAFLSPVGLVDTHIVALKIVNTLGFVIMWTMAPSVLADIVDYSKLKTKEDKGGLFFSLQMFLYKTSSAIGMAFGLAIAGWYSYDVNSVQHSASQLFGMHLAISWLPSIMFLLSLLFLASLPINSRRHDIIVRRINVLESRNKNPKFIANS